jgi:hypothetical protein
VKFEKRQNDCGDTRKVKQRQERWQTRFVLPFTFSFKFSVLQKRKGKSVRKSVKYCLAASATQHNALKEKDASEKISLINTDFL